MKKLNLKQPKYIFPLVILLPIVFLAYEISQFTKGSDDPKKGVVTDNINMSLPDAANEEMGNKMTEMNKHFSEDGAYTAIGALGDDKEEADSTMSGYSESELNDIDAENAKRTRKQKELEDLERSLAESRKHINSYGYDGGSGYGGSGGYGGRGASSRNGRNAEMDDYARELEEIQQRSLERQRVLEQTFGADDEEKERKAEEERKRLAEERKKNEVKPEVVKKADDASASMFNTINDQQAADAPLISASNSSMMSSSRMCDSKRELTYMASSPASGSSVSWPASPAFWWVTSSSRSAFPSLTTTAWRVSMCLSPLSAI